MTRILVLSVLAGIAVAVSAPAQSLDELQKGFTTKYSELNTERDGRLEKLTEGYRGALKRLMADLQKAGQLEPVLQVRDEIAAVEKGEPTAGETAAAAPPELKRLRDTFTASRAKIEEAHAKELAALADRMTTLLGKQKQQLTREGKIDEALAAEKMIAALAADAAVIKARDLAGSNTPQEPSAARQSLTKAKMKVLTNEGGYFVGWFDSGAKPALPPAMIEAATSCRESGSQVLTTIPNCTVEFQFTRPVRNFRCKIWIGQKMGDATFRLKSGETVVGSRKLTGATDRPQKFQASFDATTKLTLEVDDNGSQMGDCAMWLDPEAD